jgi:hypothetical protein
MTAFDACESRLKELKQQLPARIVRGHGGMRAFCK